MIVGGGGDDRIDAGGGADVVCAGEDRGAGGPQIDRAIACESVSGVR